MSENRRARAGGQFREAAAGTATAAAAKEGETMPGRDAGRTGNPAWQGGDAPAAAGAAAARAPWGG